MLAKDNTGKDRERFWTPPPQKKTKKNAGEWDGAVEINKEELPGSRRSMHGYLYTDLLQAWIGEPLSSGSSTDGSLIYASAEPLCEGKEEEWFDWFLQSTESIQGALLSFAYFVVAGQMHSALYENMTRQSSDNQQNRFLGTVQFCLFCSGRSNALSIVWKYDSTVQWQEHQWLTRISASFAVAAGKEGLVSTTWRHWFWNRYLLGRHKRSLHIFQFFRVNVKLV